MCCPLDGVYVGAPLPRWRRGHLQLRGQPGNRRRALPTACVAKKKKVSQGRRAGEPRAGALLACEGGSGSPRARGARALRGQSAAYAALARWVHCARCSPWVRPSVRPSGDCNGLGWLAGLLFWGVYVCVCVVLLMTVTSFTLLHSNEHPWLCYSTSEHRKTQ